MDSSNPALPLTLEGWLELLEQRHAQTIQLGLERVAEVRTRLGPDPEAVVITVGGSIWYVCCLGILFAFMF